MTIICWDGRTLAADKQVSANGHRRATTKVFQVPDGLVGFCGASIAAVAMLEWFRNGRKSENWPKVQDTDKDCLTMFIDWSGQMWIYEDHPHALKIELAKDAIGSGRDYALAALYLGFDAIKAVEVACALEMGCGMGYDFLSLEACRP